MNYFDILFAKYKFEKDHPPIIKRTTGNPIELTDAADAPLVECKTEIQGSQDLHGYDKPWVGGAGKNKFDNSNETFVSISDTNGVYSNTNTDTASSFTFMLNAYNNGTAVAVSAQIPITQVGRYSATISIESACQFLRIKHNGSARDLYVQIPWTRQGTFTVSITVDGYDVRTVGGLVFKDVQVEEGSTATSYEPYSNICPITAYTQGEIEVRGKNLVNNSTNTVGLYDEYGHYNSDSNYRTSALIEVEPNTQYPCSLYDTSDNSYVGKVVITEWSDTTTIIRQVADVDVITTSANARYIRVRNYGANSALVKSDHYGYQVETGTAVTAYNPYVAPTTHTTTYPNAIYRGSEDVVNGEATEEWKVIDLGDLTWTYASSSSQFRSSRITDIEEPADLTTMPNAICENYKTITYQNISSADSAFTVIFASSNDHGKIYVNDSRYTDATAFASAVSGVKLAYKLATPTTSSVTPTNLPIKSLSGYNHIESSTGDMDITYLTQNYQNFVDIIENNLGTRKKGGIKPLDVFRTLEVNKEPEEEEKKDEKVEDVKK